MHVDGRDSQPDGRGTGAASAAPPGWTVARGERAVRWRDAGALAARGVARRPARAALTVTAVALAAALLTALLTIATTAGSRVLDQLSKGGPLSGIRVAAAAPNALEAAQDDPTPGPSRVLDDAAV